jgi:trehalose 6-phosphate phosphatase
MRNILARACRPMLRDLAARHTLLAFDFDGTLAPIVPSRHRARLPAATVRLLRQVTTEWPCAVISGRSLADVLSRLDGVELVAVVGNHGAEERPPLPGAAGWRRRVRGWRRRIEAELDGVGGIDVEDKGLSLAVHVRGTAASRAAGRALLGLPDARIVDGKRVRNAVVREAPDKGAALARLVQRGGHARVLFVGDDDTDEDVFRRPLRVPLVGVAIGRRRHSAARYYLRSQADVARLLAILTHLRRDRPGPPQPSASPQRLQYRASASLPGKAQRGQVLSGPAPARPSSTVTMPVGTARIP